MQKYQLSSTNATIYLKQFCFHKTWLAKKRLTIKICWLALSWKIQIVQIFISFTSRETVTLQGCLWNVSSVSPSAPGNEWKTRYETQTELNGQLERQISLIHERLEDLSGNPMGKIQPLKTFILEEHSCFWEAVAQEEEQDLEHIEKFSSGFSVCSESRKKWGDEVQYYMHSTFNSQCSHLKDSCGKSNIIYI